MIIDALYYTYYWNRCKCGDADVAETVACFAIAGPLLPYVGIIIVLIHEFLIPGASDWLLGSCFALIGIILFRYLWHGKYKEIIKQHDKYDRKLYRCLANLNFLVGVGGGAIYAWLCWYLATH